MAGAFLKLKFMQQQISTNWEKDFKDGHNNLSPTEANEIIAWIKSVFGILPPCPEKEEKIITMNKNEAAKKKAEWLAYCLEIGFPKSDLDGLSNVWDKFKDENGNLRPHPLTENSKIEAVGFTEWFISDDNPYQKKYSSNDDNDGKWHDEFSEGINRHYFTMAELYNIYKTNGNDR